jgi:hypothetical protein
MDKQVKVILKSVRTARDANRRPVPEAVSAEEQVPIRLLLATDYSTGPLWFRDYEDKGFVGVRLRAFPLTPLLCDRLDRWVLGDYHLAFDYDEDDPVHEQAWHDEGLALLAELRCELGPGYDIKFSHDLSA